MGGRPFVNGTIVSSIGGESALATAVILLGHDSFPLIFIDQYSTENVSLAPIPRKLPAKLDVSGLSWIIMVDEAISDALSSLKKLDCLWIVSDQLIINWSEIGSIVNKVRGFDGEVLSPMSHLPHLLEPECVFIRGAALDAIFSGFTISYIIKKYGVQYLNLRQDHILRFREWINSEQFRPHTISMPEMLERLQQEALRSNINET
jgi:hypothetical protein